MLLSTSYENRIFRFDAVIVTTIPIRYDEFRHPQRGFLCGGSEIKNSKKSLTAICRRGLEAGTFVYNTIFIVLE